MVVVKKSACELLAFFHPRRRWQLFPVPALGQRKLKSATCSPHRAVFDLVDWFGKRHRVSMPTGGRTVRGIPSDPTTCDFLRHGPKVKLRQTQTWLFSGLGSRSLAKSKRSQRDIPSRRCELWPSRCTQSPMADFALVEQKGQTVSTRRVPGLP